MMEWIFYVVLLLAGLGIGFAVADYNRQPRRPEPGETQHACCWNCENWSEDEFMEFYDLSGICAKQSTDAVFCYTSWCYYCDDYEGDAPEEVKHE